MESINVKKNLKLLKSYTNRRKIQMQYFIQ